MSDRNDGWKSTTSALGSVRDKSVGTYYCRTARMTRVQLDALYEQNAIIARVVDRMVDDALRNGWKITGIDEETRIALDKMPINAALERAGKWSRLHGAAAITLPVDDKLKPEEPLGSGSLLTLPVMAADEIRPDKKDATFGSVTFREVIQYELMPEDGQSVMVHHSRVIPFEPVKLPPNRTYVSPNGWGPSVVERLYEEIKRDGSAAAYAVAMMYISSILSINIEGWRDEWRKKGGPERLRTILSDMREGMDALGVLGMDAGDSIGVTSISMNGVHQLLDKNRERLASASPMPREITLNESPAGLNAGELSGPQEIWFAEVAAYQQNVLTPAIKRIVGILFDSWGVDAEGWDVEWADLWTRSAKSKAETDRLDSESDRAYIDLGVVSAEEVREHRMVRGESGTVSVSEAPEVAPLVLGEIAEHEGAVAVDEGKLQDEALNGAQIASMIAIVEKVAAGLLPRDSAVQIIAAAFPSQASRAEAILGSAGVVAEPLPGEEAPPSQEPPPADLSSPRDAGAAMGVPTRTITMQIEAGTLPYWGLGKHKRVSLADVAKLAKAHESEA